MRHPIGHSRNGIEVYVDLINSGAAKHIARHPQLLGLAEEALKQTALQAAEITLERDMGRIIGHNFVVSTTDADNIFYAQLLRDETFTRFVKKGKPLSTQYLTLVLRRNDNEAAYELQDAWIGRLSPPRPGSVNETKDSRPYWATHAFVLDDQPLQLRTVTKVCPY